MKTDLRDPELQRKATEGKERAKNPAALLEASGIHVFGKPREAILFRLEQMPVTMRGNYLRAMTGRHPAIGIRAFCFMCVGWTRGEAGKCSDPACPLHPYRPEQS